jgi:UDP-GlcNAc:undecaprenyl-phosphate GlcNAc-1-phosphate transferase
MTAAIVLAAALLAAVTGSLLQPVLIRVMLRAAILDVPGTRTSHTVPTPRCGGVAVALAAVAGLALLPGTAVVLVPLLLFAGIGLAEDVRGVPVGTRLVLQSLAGLVGGALVVGWDGGATLTAALAGVLLVAAWLLGYANVANFMDGVNGIAAAHAALGGGILAAIGAARDLPVLLGGGTVVAVAAAAFLPWNAGRARIFLGDVGSYGLGGALGALAACAVWAGVPVEAAVAPFALQLADTGWTLLRRVLTGEPWYQAHRTHVYQRLTDVGWSHQRVTAVTLLVAVAVSGCGAVSLAGDPLARAVADLSALTLLAGYLTAPKRLAQLRPLAADRLGVGR